MADGGMPVRCPGCRREHLYAPPPLPCACGAPLTPPMARGAPPTPVTDRSWADEWVTVRCPACGRRCQWPQPELDCACGTVLRLAVVPIARAAAPPRRAAPAHIPLPRTAPRPRPAFRPAPIRDARDAVATAALYLRWLGYRDTRSATRRPPSGTRITARGMVAQVDPGLRRVAARDVECLWLTAMTAAGDTPLGRAFFCLAGYTGEARARADTLGVPLFTIDLTGTPQPVNGAADELVARGA
ncbi:MULTISPECIES: hypothetical protein [Streptomyces]|uniref:hypothetical protein n=1 Tax=Streptomyces TaxID=1883 RepID=UPI001E4FBD26|nr:MULTISPECIES: hypothetical protein [Streptomyces]UFQ18947.1 hypothetical protein J2N69_30440 [Streptomyces huasconensis]WCL88566.1 hypothetical protein PPN52_30405 [Streptomyces sp. JCM 35825]